MTVIYGSTDPQTELTPASVEHLADLEAAGLQEPECTTEVGTD